MMRTLLLALVSATLTILAPDTHVAHAAGCPVSVSFLPTGDGTFDAGWTGIEHGIPIAGVTLDLALDCAASEPPCGVCTIVGTAMHPSRPQRCRNDSSRACTVATELADCGAPATCATFLSPPQSVGLGGLPFCYTTELAGPVIGTVDTDTGLFAPSVPILAQVRWGVGLPPIFAGGPMQACVRCVGDAVANDGLAAGTCDAGPRNGLACDAHATSGVPDFGSSSFDCPTDTLVLIDYAVGAIPAASEPLEATLGLASPPCTGGSSLCQCSTCNNAAAEPCSSNLQCPPSGGNPGICNGRRCLSGANNGAPCTATSECPGGNCGRPGELTKPHACLDDTTTLNGPADDCGSDGRCINGPVDTYCANHPDRGCLNDGACDDVPGACTARNRPCFRDNGVLGGTVAVDGTSTPPLNGVAEPTDLASLACLPPSASPTMNTVGGFPGLVRTHQPGRLVFDDTLTSSDVCPATPAACRTPIASRRALVQIDDRTPDAKDQLQFKWSRGQATTWAELGDPRTNTPYALCVYDAGGLRAAHSILAGRTCGGKPCWRARPNGYSYRDAAGGASGVTRIDLVSGIDGKAQAKVKGKGELLPLPAPASLVAPLTVQLRNRGNGVCFGATFTAPFDVATETKLKDLAD